MNKIKKNRKKNYTWTTVLSRSKEMAGRNDHVVTHQRGYHFTSYHNVKVMPTFVLCEFLGVAVLIR